MDSSENHQESQEFARDVILSRLNSEYGLFKSFTMKLFRWEIVPHHLHVVLLEADCGTIVLPWDEGRDVKPYFGEIAHARFKDGKLVREGRNSNLPAGAPSLGWDRDIIYLRAMTTWELDRVVEFINRKRHGASIPTLGEPDPDAPILGIGAKHFGSGGRGPIPWAVVRAVFERDQGRCAFCGSTEKLRIDHVIPRIKGGSDEMKNLQVLCERHNASKSDTI